MRKWRKRESGVVVFCRWSRRDYRGEQQERLRPGDAGAPGGNPAEITLFLKLRLSHAPRRNTNMSRCSCQASLSAPLHTNTPSNRRAITQSQLTIKQWEIGLWNNHVCNYTLSVKYKLSLAEARLRARVCESHRIWCSFTDSRFSFVSRVLPGFLRGRNVLPKSLDPFLMEICSAGPCVRNGERETDGKIQALDTERWLLPWGCRDDCGPRVPRSSRWIGCGFWWRPACGASSCADGESASGAPATGMRPYGGCPVTLFTHTHRTDNII